MHVSVKLGEYNATVNIYTDVFAKDPILTFWVPISSLDEHGFVPANIIRARFKHRFKTHLGHFSYTTVT